MLASGKNLKVITEEKQKGIKAYQYKKKSAKHKRRQKEEKKDKRNTKQTK